VREAEVYLGFGISAGLLKAAPGLKWVHSGTAGVGGSLTPEMVQGPVMFTNSKGIHGPPMADTALAMMLYFGRGLDFAVTHGAQGRWNTEPFYGAGHPLTEMSSSVVGIFGFGGIGRQVAQRAMAVGAQILAFDRDPVAFQGAGRMTMGSEPDLSDPALDALHGQGGLDRLLAESDYLVLTAPETPQTRGTFDASALGRMKESAVLINLSRGGIVVEEDLIQALRTRRLRGAGLDVFQQEPLPVDHPFWTLPNVLVTPHVSAVTRGFWRRQCDLILENLVRYRGGEPLLNLVDKRAGF
jgi:phosphoglycerate dehydrogenase-like enzyme